MALPTTLRNWSVNTYTNNTWTPLVSEPSIIHTLCIVNTSGSSVTVDLRREDSGSLAVILAPYSIGPNESYVFDKVLNITGSQALEFRASAAGVELDASGSV